MSSKVEYVWNTSRSLTDVREWARSSLVPVLEKWGYRVDADSVDCITLERRRSFWPMVFISPLAFLVSPYQKDHAVVAFASLTPGGTRMTVTGDLPRKIVAVLNRLPQAELGPGLHNQPSDSAC